MRNCIYSFLCLFISCLCLPSQAQQKIGFIMPPNVDRVEIEFEQYSNLIVIPIKINNTLTLKFVLDTGAESIILTEKLFADLMGLKYVREMIINAPGVADSIKTFVASDVSLEIGTNIKGEGFNLLVLENDFIELSKNLGAEVYGVIGYDLFHRYTVEVIYDDNKLVIHRPEMFKPRGYYEEHSISLLNAKPHLQMVVEQGAEQDTMLFMVDTGASHAALIDVNTSEHLVYPDKVIPTQLGMGLGGVIHGQLGRMDQFLLGKYEFQDVLISIPEEGVYNKAIKRGNRHGTIGGELLSRFDVVFDYYNHRMLFKKGQLYGRPFEYNMSGMNIIAEGDDLNVMMVTHVIEDSPAFLAGVKPGDFIIKINGMSLQDTSMPEVQNLLKKRENKKIRLTLVRDEKKIKVRFRLKRLI